MNIRGWNCNWTTQLVVLVLAVGLFVPGCKRAANHSDEQLIQGTWEMVRNEVRGKELPLDMSGPDRR